MSKLTSLLLVEERLPEAEYFTVRLSRQRDPLKFRYEVNAFLSAARSVTFLLQKELARVPGFDAWWARLAEDRAARFFLELRNFSQKQGRVSLVGAATGRSSRRRWTYCFAGTAERVPAELLHRDAVDCSREHVRKLAIIVLSCTERFPFHTCPRRALTPEGLQTLGFAVEDIEEALGYPKGWTACAAGTVEDRLRVLRRQMDGLDFDELHRLSRLRLRGPQQLDSDSAALSDSLLHSLVDEIESLPTSGGKRDPIRKVLGKLILARHKG